MLEEVVPETNPAVEVIQVQRQSVFDTTNDYQNNMTHVALRGRAFLILAK